MSIKTFDHVCGVVFLFICIVLVIGFFGCAKSESPSEDYAEIESAFIAQYFNVRTTVVGTESLTAEILDNHRGILIERCIGVVINDEGDGRVLNPKDPKYDCISYANCGFPVRAGMKIVTYFIYPEGYGYDDFTKRIDFEI